MSVKVFYEILNQRDTPAMFADVFSNRPAFGYNGRIFISTDTKQIYRDYGTFWDLIADAGAGSGNLQSVTTNGNFTTTDIDMLSGNLILRSLTPGGVLFTNASEIVTQDVTNFFWDDTNNRLGIRTNTPGVAFDVHSTDQVIQQLNNTTTTDSFLSFLNQGTGKWRIGNYYNSNSNDYIIYDTTNGTTRQFITNTGYTIIPNSVIIGSSNRSSAYGLDSYVSANFQSTLRVQGASTFLSQIGGTSALFSSSVTAGAGMNVTGSTNSSGANYLELQTTSTYYAINAINRSSGNYNQPLFIDGQKLIINSASAGNVAIGTTAPMTFGGFTNLTISSSSTTNQAALFLTNSSVSIRASFYTDGTSLNARLGTATAHPLIFDTTDIERMRITSGGNVLIGTTTDYGYKLVVASDNGLYVRGGSTSSHQPLLIHNSSGSNLFSVRGDGIINTGLASGSPYNNTSAQIPNLYVSAGGTLERGTASSGRFKENILEWNGNGLDTILALKPKTFKYKKEYYNKADIEFLGLIAEEVAVVSPFLADFENENRTGQVENVRYATIVVPLIKAIQELNDKLVRNNIN
jgi:hypothetical protein